MKKSEARSLAVFVSMAAGIIVYSSYPLAAQGTDEPAKAVQPDNSGVNKVERDHSSLGAGQARNDRSDVKIMREIRRSLTQDKSLSIYAHNVKIIAKEGKVTLKGPVHTQEEKDRIGAEAGRIVGPDNVDNQLTVKES